MKRFRKTALILAVVLVLPHMVLPAAAEENAPGAPPLQAETQEGISSLMTAEIRDPSGPVTAYHRPEAERIHMPSGDQYTRLKIGIPTFRGTAFRQNASAGFIADPSSLQVLWKAETGSAPDGGERSPGIRYDEQPLIARWAVEVRTESEMYPDKKLRTALKEVIVPGADGSLHFFDLEDGSRTRDPFRADAPFAGTLSLSPAGLPLLTAETASGLYLYNTYNMREPAPVPGLSWEATPTDLSRVPGSWTSPLIDYTSDAAVTAGSDGMLYLISLNTSFDWHGAQISTDPSVAAAKYTAAGEENSLTAVKSPVSMYDRYAFYADMGGILRCVDTDTLSPVWTADTGDSVIAATALDLTAGGLDLYTGNVLNLRSEGGARIRRYNALNGGELWRTEIGVDSAADGSPYAGCAASPVVGREGLKDLVFFTVTGLNEKGREMLGVPGEARAAVAALEKETGSLRWARGLAGSAFSSPAAVYDEDGNGWIIQCAQDGTVLLLEGLTGSEAASLSVDGRITASPAVYNNVMVIRTDEGSVLGIRIGSR